MNVIELSPLKNGNIRNSTHSYEKFKMWLKCIRGEMALGAIFPS